MKECLFCKFVRKEIETTLLYEDDDLIAINDINPQAPVHILLIPKKHLSSTLEATEGDKQLLGSVLLASGKIAKEQGLSENGFRVVVNTGNHGGQTVFHIHFHLVGGRQMGWPPG
ncbi:MAG: histidine triad nucleotide-binding protein [Nitrospinota bacterium]